MKQKNKFLQAQNKKFLKEINVKNEQLNDRSRGHQKYKVSLSKLRANLEKQCSETQLWTDRANQALQKLRTINRERSKDKKSKAITKRNDSVENLRDQHSNLLKTHERCRAELRSTKAEALALSKSNKNLKAALEQAERKQLDMERQLRIAQLKLKNNSPKKNVLSKITPSKKPNMRTPSFETSRSSSVDSISSDENDIEHEFASSLNQSVRSEPTRNLAAYDRYRKLKNMYVERYATINP